MTRPADAHGIGLREATGVWVRLALQSLGGPAGQIAVLHRLVVEERRWISERRFLHALNYAMLLPGPEAQQLTTYVGWLLHGARGGLIAGGLFILPGFLTILVLSVVYATYGGTRVVAAVFAGVTPVVVALVAGAVWRLGRRIARTPTAVVLAVVAFVAIAAGDVPFPLVVAGAAATGLAVDRLRPGLLTVPEAADRVDIDERPPAVRDDVEPVRPTWRRSVIVLAVGLTLWAAPVVVLGLATGWDSVWVDLGRFFSGAAVVTFGGAYAVLAYVAQAAVDAYGWLAPGEMIDGLAMAESTPGPLIQVVQFVGYLAAARAATGLSPILAGTAGAVLTTWVTFVPSFLWILLGAPAVEWLRGVRRLTAALSAVTAAVVGVIASLAWWFALHATFGTVAERRLGPGVLDVPELATFEPVAAALVVAAAVALHGLRWPLVRVLALGATVGAAISALFAG
jgi:chromate transporter